jgi:hypothetical protein
MLMPANQLLLGRLAESVPNRSLNTNDQPAELAPARRSPVDLLL